MSQLGMENQEAHVALGRRNRTETHKLITHAVDCDDIVERKSGVYRIYPIGGMGFNVYCDWSKNNEGWTVRYYSLIDCCLTR
jgi:hypothetical protein